MAWYPGARKMELQPESDSQPAIRPTQFIMHSIAAPWTPRRIYEYWAQQGINLDCHFGLGYDGSLGQFIGTETRADANYKANRRDDGTGAVSIETASNLQHTDPWTDAQIAKLIELGVWLHRTHGIPLRICRTASDPGFGYHRLHSAWAVSGTDCPGDARVKQFNEQVFPGIVRAAQGGTLPTPTVPEDDMPAPIDLWSYKNPQLEQRDAYQILRDTAADARKAAAGPAVQVDAAAVAAALGSDEEFRTALARAIVDEMHGRLEA